MDTAELMGTGLDWAVAKAQGLVLGQIAVDAVRHGFYSPSTDWSVSGPIIEREGISVINTHGSMWAATTHPVHQVYQDHTEAHFQGVGPTPLTAAMRCYVTVKLGNEVELPAELI